MRKMTGFTAAAAVLVTTVGLSATPAEARGRHGGWHNRHDDGIGAGEIIGGILILGTIAAVASAASKQNREARNRDYRYDPPYRDDRAQAGGLVGAEDDLLVLGAELEDVDGRAAGGGAGRRAG